MELDVREGKERANRLGKLNEKTNRAISNVEEFLLKFQPN